MSNQSRIIGMIPARYGSTRFPGKALKEVAGKSLIRHTYENAAKCPLLDVVVVATDDDRIYKHVEQFGGRVVMTSAGCASGSDRLAEAVRESHEFDDSEIIVNIQGDEPCIEVDTISKIVEVLQDDPQAAVSTAVFPIKNLEAAFDRNVVKCTFNQFGHALYFSRGLIPCGRDGAFHEDRTYYQHIGIYGYKREFLLHYNELQPTPLQLAEDLEQLKILEHGYNIHVAIVQGNSIGVDTPEDLIKIEKILCGKNSSS